MARIKKRHRGHSGSALEVSHQIMDAGLTHNEMVRVRRWVDWTKKRKYVAVPAIPEQLSAFLAGLAGHDGCTTYGSIRKYARSIERLHVHLGLGSPLDSQPVEDALEGLRRELGVAPQQTAEAITAERFGVIKQSVLQLIDTETITEGRGRLTLTLISLMRDAMMLAHEPKDLRLGDIRTLPDGTGEVAITTRRGEKIFRFLSVETMRYVRGMRDGKQDDDHLLAQKDHCYGVLIRDAAERAGLGSSYSAWSPRVGMAVDLLKGGAGLPAVMAEGRWRNRARLPEPIRKQLEAKGGVARYYARKSS